MAAVTAAIEESHLCASGGGPYSGPRSCSTCSTNSGDDCACCGSSRRDSTVKLPASGTARPNQPKDTTYVGIFDIFKIGLGPSSSHTMGPMWAGKRFAEHVMTALATAGGDDVVSDPLKNVTIALKAHLYGSLALTGKGHATDKATVLGLAGFQPDTINPDTADETFRNICSDKKLLLNGRIPLVFDFDSDVTFHYDLALPLHPNAMTLRAEIQMAKPTTLGQGSGVNEGSTAESTTFSSSGLTREKCTTVYEETYYSIGGGFIKTEKEMLAETTGCSASVVSDTDTAVASQQTAVSTTTSLAKSGGCWTDSVCGTTPTEGSGESPGVEGRGFDSHPNAQTSPVLVAVENISPNEPQQNEGLLHCGLPKETDLQSVSPPDSPATAAAAAPSPAGSTVPYFFQSAAELVILAKTHDMSIAQIMYANECALKGWTLQQVYEKIDAIAAVIDGCVERGLRMEGRMPVSKAPRRAAQIRKRLNITMEKNLHDPLAATDWIALYAMSVNEENACGGRVVTAPTNGASGTLPGVLTYYRRSIPTASKQGVRDFLATAAAVGSLCKRNASISGAEAGCQAEVGSACAMAAAGLAAVLGGTTRQIENAAEIGLEHCLGMTCDPILGLVQIPCIERNCVAAVKAVMACRLAMMGDGTHDVSLDSCIETMYRTGLDMQAKYRETSTGGLAIFAKKFTF